MSRQATPAHFHKSKTLDNKYMIGDKIGKGAYGTVYRGLDLENVDFVAIKQVSLENILQEDLNFIMVRSQLLIHLSVKLNFSIEARWRQEIDLLKVNVNSHSHPAK
ncbi:hypothetical protein ZIOFF_008835 [Zingiber officinale]|uniref:non-specific serine/threonine protein kinase n=1 Tax=Zingiber officinale TaxID=94328 RepID=A0A8J5LXI2_ZINOF|nr:hypothetical protein ZIOFF_008835 [Zingiber officinale]